MTASGPEIISQRDMNPRAPQRPRSPRSGAGGSREPDYAGLAELRYRIRRFLTFSESAARAAGIEPQQHQLLLAIKGLPAGERPTIRALAERLQLKHHTVVGLADRLVRARLIERTPSEDDGRAIWLRISARGERLLRRLSLAHRAELEVAGPALSAALRAIARRRKPGRSREKART